MHCPSLYAKLHTNIAWEQVQFYVPLLVADLAVLNAQTDAEFCVVSFHVIAVVVRDTRPMWQMYTDLINK
jgi:hypothetical protein